MALDAQTILEPIFQNDVSAVRLLLAATPALAHVRDAVLDSTPLHFSAHRGFAAIVDALLAAGADVKALEGVSGTTPLHWAAEGGHVAIVRELLARGAGHQVRDTWFSLTPLGWATVVDWSPQRQVDRPGAAAALREAGAKDDIFTLVVGGDAARVRAFVAGRQSAPAQRLGFVGRGMTPLHVAVKRGLAAMVPVLLAVGADVAAVDADGLSPLALALADGHAEIAAVLRGHGVDASAKWIAGEPVTLDRAAATRLLGYAAASGRDVVALISAGADIDATSLQLVGETPLKISALQRAAAGGHVRAVRALLDRGAATGAAEAGAPTPLHVAAGAGHLEVVRALLEAGVDPCPRERQFGATPRGWAEFAGHVEVAALFEAVVSV